MSSYILRIHWMRSRRIFRPTILGFSKEIECALFEGIISFATPKSLEDRSEFVWPRKFVYPTRAMTRDSISDESRHARNVFWTWHPCLLSFSTLSPSPSHGKRSEGERRDVHPFPRVFSLGGSFTDRSRFRTDSYAGANIAPYQQGTGGGRLSFSKVH